MGRGTNNLALLPKGNMKKLLIAIGLFAGLALAVLAADPRGRVDTRFLAGVKNFVQDEVDRNIKPVQVVNSLAYTITNSTDGIIFVRTNATVLVHIGLPNPTNNYGRKIEVTTMGASTAILTNVNQVGTITSNNSMATLTGYLIGSNKTAIAYSTGTNWIARDY